MMLGPDPAMNLRALVAVSDPGAGIPGASAVMGGLSWGDPVWLWAALAGPLVWLVVAWGSRARRRAAGRLIEPSLQGVVGARVRGWGRRLRGASMGLAIVCIAVGLARPRWDPQPREVSRQGRDVVFVVDVSRSMLAQDLAPSRLERAKIWIRDLVQTLEGDRVGLVAFAGAAVVKCPLTQDYGFFRLSLDELTPDSVPRGGTNIGDALRKVMSDVYLTDPEAEGNFRDIVLITDGEDQESLPVEAASAAGRAGVRIIAIGLGSDEAGATIPVEGGRAGERALTYRGEAVRSRQDSRGLVQIATASQGGVYLNVGTGTIDLDKVYADLVRSAAQTTTSTDEAVRYTEGFQWALLAAFMVLLLEALSRERSRSDPLRAGSSRAPWAEGMVG